MIDIGSGYFVKFRHNEAGKRVGIMIWQREPRKIMAGLFWERPDGNHMGPLWTLVSEDPLHIEPSIHNPETGWHGYIRNGKWEDA